MKMVDDGDILWMQFGRIWTRWGNGMASSRGGEAARHVRKV